MKTALKKTILTFCVCFAVCIIVAFAWWGLGALFFALLPITAKVAQFIGAMIIMFLCFLVGFTIEYKLKKDE